MRIVLSFFLCLLALSAQESSLTRANLQALSDRVRAAMGSGDWKLAAELSSKLKVAVTEARDRALAASSNDQIARVLAWLPENTETIVVAQQPFTLSESNQNSEHNALTMTHGYVLGLLGSLDDDKVFKGLSGSTVRFAVLAARKFGHREFDGGSAAALGMIGYQGCAVYAFGNGLAKTTFSQPHDTVILGQPVWIWKRRQEGQAHDAIPRYDTYLAARIEPDMMLACNNQDFLSTVLLRMTATSTSSKFPSLPEWKQVDRSASVWGIRHFIPESAATDPTHPANGWLLKAKDPNAIGITFQVGMPSGKVQVRWLTASKDNPWQDFAATPDFQGAATTKAISEGVWEISVNDELGPGSFAVFAFMALLGFAVLV